jgi:hypothetical protein
VSAGRFSTGIDSIADSVEPTSINDKEVALGKRGNLTIAAERTNWHSNCVIEGCHALVQLLPGLLSLDNGMRGAVNAPGGCRSASAIRSRLSAETGSPRSTRSIVDNETPAKPTNVSRFHPIIPRFQRTKKAIVSDEGIAGWPISASRSMSTVW